MYKQLLIPVDNSEQSNMAIDLGIIFAKAMGSTITGNHVYAARLHDDRFRQMESDLPEEYQEESEIERQRKIHDVLITKGLEMISDSFVDVVTQRCVDAGLPPCERSLPEGKNYTEIVKDCQSGTYDLTIMGMLGLGRVPSSTIGSVCERVVRRVTKTDLLVVKKEPKMEGTIMVCIDGSHYSFAAMETAVNLSKLFGVKVEGVAVFDPAFHTVAFNSLEGVLSEEAGKVFKFKEQEQLHGEVIDKGLQKIYEAHLKRSVMIAIKNGVEVKETILAGKPYDEIIKHVEKVKPCLLILGKLGYHCDEGLDIGNNAENLLLSADANILLVNRKYEGRLTYKGHSVKKLEWSDDAVAKLNRAPKFVHKMIMKMVNEFANEKGYSKITAEVVDEAREHLGIG